LLRCAKIHGDGSHRILTDMRVANNRIKFKLPRLIPRKLFIIYLPITIHLIIIIAILA